MSADRDRGNNDDMTSNSPRRYSPRHSPRHSPRQRKRRAASPTKTFQEEKKRGRPIWIDLKDKRGSNDQGKLLIYIEMRPVSSSSSRDLDLEQPGEGTLLIEMKSVRSFEKIDALLEMSTPKGLESMTRRLRLGVVGPGKTDVHRQQKLKLPVESVLGLDGILSPALRLVLREAGSNRKIGSASVSLREFLISKQRKNVWVSIREDEDEEDEIAAVRFEMSYVDNVYRDDNVHRDDDDVYSSRSRSSRWKNDSTNDSNESLQKALNVLRPHVHDIRLALFTESDDGVHASKRQVRSALRHHHHNDEMIDEIIRRTSSNNSNSLVDIKLLLVRRVHSIEHDHTRHTRLNILEQSLKILALRARTFRTFSNNRY